MGTADVLLAARLLEHWRDPERHALYWSKFTDDKLNGTRRRQLAELMADCTDEWIATIRAQG